MVGVVNVVVAVAVIDAGGAGGQGVAVADSYRRLPAGDVLVVHGLASRVAQSRIYRVVAAEVHKRIVGVGLPLL